MSRQLAITSTDETFPDGLKLLMDVTGSLLPIYDLLASGVNTKLTLEKSWGTKVEYELAALEPPAKSGPDKIRDAIRLDRGGEAPTRIQGFA